MAFNTRNSKTAKPQGTSPIQTSTVANTRTGNGAVGFTRDAKSELFLAATTSFFGQDKFYETKDAFSQRFVGLVHEVAKADPAWMLNFITWLRSEGNIRSGAVVASVEAAYVYGSLPTKQRMVVLKGEQDFGRRLAKAGIQRPDEIGEAVAYYASQYGVVDKESGAVKVRLPKPIKRGLADALTSKITEFSYLKYDSDGKSWKLADLINILHPSPKPGWQADLFGYAVASRYGEVDIPETLDTLRIRAALMGMEVGARRNLVTQPGADRILKDAGMTWESLAGWLQGPMDKAAWEAIIPNMGIMAQLRNLRNFDQAGVSDRAIQPIIAKLFDPEEIAKSKQLPFRFLTAYRNAPSVRWHYPLAKALDASIANIPPMPGRTLVLVDVSGSMDYPMSEHGQVKRWDIAALFGIAIAKRMGTVNVVAYSGNYQLQLKEFKLKAGAEVLTECERWKREGYNMGGGTPTAQALQATFMGHDRVIILTDEQANVHGHVFGVGQVIPDTTPLYTFNLAGLKAGHTAGGRFRHTFGGLTDHAFGLIPMIEAGEQGRWPWENAA